MKELGKKYNFSVISIPPVEVTLLDQSLVQVSSSIVRWLLKNGRVDEASLLLGRPYEISGTVIKGEQLGRRIGFPTANISQIETMIPKVGVYAGEVVLNGVAYSAAISIGTKPTFESDKISFEVHLIDFDGALDDYNWSITVKIKHWIRDQIKFDSVKSLTCAINNDVENARNLLESLL